MNADPQVKLNKALADMNTALIPLFTAVAEFVGKIATWVSQNSTLAAIIAAVVVGLGILMGIIMGLVPVVLGLITAFEVAAVIFAAITSPIGLAVLAIAALIAIIALCASKWGLIKEKAQADFNELVGIVVGIGGRIKTQFNKDLADFISIWVNMGRRIRDKFNSDVDDIKRIASKIGSFLSSINLSQIGHDIMQGFLNGISGMATRIWNKAKEIASGVGKWLKKALDVGSPSKVTYQIGLDTGAGLQFGLADSMKPIKETAIDMANAVISSLDKNFNDKDNVLTSYFEAIQEDGDYLNDMLTHMPKNVANVARQMGKVLAPSLEGTRIVDYNKDWDGNNKYISVTLNSPKALDVREANRVFTSTMNKMALMW
jgi:hypothetical protein